MIQVRLFEEEHEQDLEQEINEFLSEIEEDQFVDLKLSCSHFLDEQQIYSFCACVLYRIKPPKKDKLKSGRKSQ